MENWHSRLRDALEARGQGIDDLVRVTKKKKPSVWSWVKNNKGMIDGDNATLVCNHLRINPMWLFFGKGPSGLEEAGGSAKEEAIHDVPKAKTSSSQPKYQYQDGYWRTITHCWPGMSDDHKDAVAMLTNKLYSMDNPDDPTADPSKAGRRATDKGRVKAKA